MSRLDTTGLQRFKSKYDAFIAALLGYDIAATYDSNSTYEVGSYVIHDNLLYKARYDISTAESWNAAHWTQVALADEFSTSAGGYERVLASLATEYSTNSAYSVGDYCLHDNYLYKCTTAISNVGENWNSAHWNRAVVGDELATINANIDKLFADVDAEYSSSSTYAVGNYCLHNGVLYKCNTAIDSPGETWNNDHWTSITIADEIETLFSYIEQIIPNIALEYDTTSTYYKRDICLHDGQLYVCTANTASPAGTWNGTYWSSTNLGSVVASLSKSLDDTISAMADEYEVKAYAVGDYCWHYDSTALKTCLYRCTTAISSPGEAWNALHWTQVTLADEIANANAVVEKLKTDIANTYDSSSAYAVGDYCLHDDLLYECNTAITNAGEAWNITHWDQVSITNVLKNKVDKTREINGYALDNDITLDAGDIEYDSEETYDSGTVGNELVKITTADIEALF